MSWQKPVRIAVAIVGLASAAGVYLVMGQRRVAPPAAPIQSRIPDAQVEVSGCVLKNFPGLAKNFEVECDLMGFYPDGTKKLTGSPLRIRVHKADNRTFTVTGREARVSQDENYIEVFGGPVRLEDSDGFWLETDRATVNRIDQISHVPGAATFGKGRMTGSGIGFSYDNEREILLISQQARVRTVDERGTLLTDLASSTAMLDRLQHVLTLDTGVHVVREDQVIDTDHANGRLSASNEIVTFIELFGNSRVSGGPSIDSMKARDITLDYTDDGTTLESSTLVGDASIAMKGAGEGPGRRIEGETVELTLAADGMLTSAVARPAPERTVRLDLPASSDTPARTITAQTLDGTGQPGRGLTHARFTGGVLFAEEPLRSKAAAADTQSGARTARSQRLEISLDDDAVTAATFTGETTFEEAGLKACAAQATYNPQKSSLALSGVTKAGAPMVADEQVAIEGSAIDVALETRNMTAIWNKRDKVTTFMRSPAAQRCRPSRPRPASEQGARNVPRLLDADAEATVTSDRLDYDSQKGHAVYTGRSILVQGDTSITADRLVLDQTKGDLTATGNAITRLVIDGKRTEGRADEVRYVDATRLLTYLSLPKTPTVSLDTKPDSSLRAGRVVITLNAKENKAETMQARGNVRLVEGPQNVTGATLDYTAQDEQFVVRGDSARAAGAASRDGGHCRITNGDVITFRKGGTNVAAEGLRRRSTTEPLQSGACTPTVPSPPSTAPVR